jgi:hypothetical protein
MRFFHKYYCWYFIGYVVMLGLFSYSDRISKTSWRLAWSFFSPLAGSIIGYIGVSVGFYSDHGYVVRQTYLDWIFVCVVNAYFMAQLWTISFAFFAFCVVDFNLIKGKSRLLF